MKWIQKDLQQYKQAKEYVDTILIPLIPFQFAKDADLEKGSFQREALSMLADDIERELTGRVMLTPSYNYVKSMDMDKEAQRMNEWADHIREQPFQHVFCLTFDSAWKKHEKELDGELVWVPGVQSGDLRAKQMQGILRDQAEQVVELIRTYW